MATAYRAALGGAHRALVDVLQSNYMPVSVDDDARDLRWYRTRAVRALASSALALVEFLGRRTGGVVRGWANAYLNDHRPGHGCVCDEV